MEKIIIIFFVIISLLTGCSNDKIEYEIYDYEYRDVIFSFDYPRNWIVKPIAVWDATDESVTDPLLIKEASPERGGINLYDMEGSDNSLYIFCGVSNYSNLFDEDTTEESELFIGKDKIADMRINRDDEGVKMQLWYIKNTSFGYYQAIVRVTEEFYDENEQILWHILRSLDY